MVLRFWISLILFGELALSSSVSIVAQEQPAEPPLHEQIDRLLGEQTYGVPLQALPEISLLRRLSLDLIGLPPTYDEILAYQGDPAPDRWIRQVDHLLERPEFAEHWANRFDVMLMERRGNTNIPQELWLNWLRDRIVADRPLHELFAELVVADGAPGPDRAAVRFLLDRDVDPHLITRDVGRIFFGVDLQCAQCHDHPAIDSYLQSDYHGLLGFVAGLAAVEVPEGETKIKIVTEKSSVEAPFESVFNRGQLQRVFPHTPGELEQAPPWVIPGEDYQAASVAGHPPRPVHSRTEQLAAIIRRGDHPRLAQTLANRLWSMLFGRGVIHPVDFVHPASPARDARLLPLLAAGLRQQGYQLKPFLRSLVQTQTYRLGQPPLQYAPTENDSLAGNAGLTGSVASDGSSAPADGSASSSASPLGEPLRESLIPGGPRPAWLDGVVASAAARQTELTVEIEAARQAVDQAKEAYLQSRAAMAEVDRERIAALGVVDAARNPLAQTVEAEGKKQSEVAAAKQAATTASEHVIKLQQAHDATAAAIASIGEDAAVQGALAAIAQRLAVAQGVLAPAEKALQDRSAELATILQQRAEQRAALLAATAAADPVESRWMLLDQQRHAMRSNWEGAQSKLATLRSEEEVVIAWLQCDQAFRSVATEQSPGEELPTPPQWVAKIAAMAPPSSSASLASQLEQLAELSAAIVAARSQLDQLDVLVSQQRAILGERFQSQLDAITALEQKLGEFFQAKLLVPLTPEQMGWSTLVATGVMKNYIAKHRAELESGSPATAEQQADPVWNAARHEEAVRRARKELVGNVNVFVSLFGHGAGQPQGDFFATADQALYTSNGGTLFAWAAPGGENVTQRMIAAADPKECAKILYWSVLARDPSSSEVRMVEEFLSGSPDQRPRLSQEMVWGLMAGAEFRFRP